MKALNFLWPKVFSLKSVDEAYVDLHVCTRPKLHLLLLSSLSFSKNPVTGSLGKSLALKGGERGRGDVLNKARLGEKEGREGG